MRQHQFLVPLDWTVDDYTTGTSYMGVVLIREYYSGIKLLNTCNLVRVYFQCLLNMLRFDHAHLCPGVIAALRNNYGVVSRCK